MCRDEEREAVWLEIDVIIHKCAGTERPDPSGMGTHTVRDEYADVEVHGEGISARATVHGKANTDRMMEEIIDTVLPYIGDMPNNMAIIKNECTDKYSIYVQPSVEDARRILRAIMEASVQEQ